MLDTPLPEGLRATDQHLLVAGRANGAYRLAGADEARLHLADEPILDVTAGDAVTIVPWAGISRVAPHAFRLVGDIRAASLPPMPGRNRFLRSPGEPWRSFTGTLDSHSLPGRDVTLAFADTDLAADTQSPTIVAVHDGKGIPLPSDDLGFRRDLRQVVFNLRDDATLRPDLAEATLVGEQTGRLPVNLPSQGEDLVCSLPEQLPEDTFTLTLAVGDAALNQTRRSLTFNTVGQVLRFRDLEVMGSSGGDVKYFPELDTRFYRGTQPGDWVEFAFTAPAAGRYELRLVYTQFDAYAILQASLDGTPCGEPFDLYGKELAAGAGAAELGAHELAAGSHRLRLEIVGKNPAAKAHLLGVCRLVLKPVEQRTPPR